MGLFERRLKRKVMRDIKQEEVQAKRQAGLDAANRQIDNSIRQLEDFSAKIEELIKVYREKAKQAQRNNNKAVFNSYVAQVINLQKMLDNNTLMMVDAIRHADSQRINKQMMAAQAAIGDLVNPKLDISDKDMLATREKYVDNATNLNMALQRDSAFTEMFDGIYMTDDSSAEKGLFDKIAGELESEVAHEEAAMIDSDMGFTVKAGTGLDELRESMRREREALEMMRNKK